MAAKLRLHTPDDAAPKKRKGRRLPTFFRDDEIASLLTAADQEVARATLGTNTHGHHVCCVHVYRYACQDRMILILGAFLGLRVSEQTGLRVEHVNLDAREVFVRGKGGVERLVPIPLRMLEELRSWITFRKRGYLLVSRRGRRVATSTVNSRLRRLAKLAGLHRHIHSHALRHTFGTKIYSLTKDLLVVRDLLGHASVSTTQVYTHCAQNGKRDAVDLL